MIIYFADRNLNVRQMASTSLPQGYRISEDLLTEDVESGVNTFSCRVGYTDDESRWNLENSIEAGMYVLKSRGSAFTDAENIYDSLYQITETEFDTKEQSLYIYAEDAGLELINRISGSVTLTDKSLEDMLEYFLPSDWEINLLNTPAGNMTVTFEGENTVTERINSVASLFGCEVYYSFEIERFEILSKVLNVTLKRGRQEAVHQLRLNMEIDRITTKTSATNLATALEVTGGTPEGSETPITLAGYSYSYTDENEDVFEVDSSTGQMRCTTQMENWRGVLDSDGLIVKTFSYDTADKAELAGQARAYLQGLIYPEVNYEVEFTELPDDIQAGDRVNVIDEDGELYLDTRILVLETSVADETRKVTLGDHIIRDSRISDRVQAIADELKSRGKAISGTTVTITSSGGNVFHNTPIATSLSATVFYGAEAITTVTRLQEVYGQGAALKWYNASEELVFTGFGPHSVTSTTDTVKYKVRLET